MFENSSAQRQSPQVPRSSSKRSSSSSSAAAVSYGLGSSAADCTSPGGQQRLKNAINLGKAKMTDLLRRKEPAHLGDIGVTEVNKNVDPSWSSRSPHRPLSALDSFPRLDPPPPSGKKRVPRALKTTQDMMISSVPVVSSPEAADPASCPPTPEKTPPTPEKTPPGTSPDTTVTGRTTPTITGQEEAGQMEEEPGSRGSIAMDTALAADTALTTDTALTADTALATDLDEASRIVETPLELSIPDLINKDPPEAWLKGGGADPALCPGQDAPQGNGAPCGRGGGEEAEVQSSPDLLSFE